MFRFFGAEETRCTDQSENLQGVEFSRPSLLPVKFHCDRFRGVDLWPLNFENYEFYQYNCPKGLVACVILTNYMVYARP